MKYYFDTTGLVKIYHMESGSSQILKIYKGAEDIVISELSTIELISTIHRIYRQHDIDYDTLEASVAKFQEDVKNRYEIVSFFSLVIDEALNLICKHADKHSLTGQWQVLYCTRFEPM